MRKFGKRSLENLKECHPKLQLLMTEVLKVMDVSIIEGHRPKAEQDKAFHAGKSKLKWPNSKHNKKPSLAVDVVPYPVDWKDTARFYYMCGVIKACAFNLGINIRLGADWDGDNEFKDQTFHDLPHVELVEE